jgi:hypothetical protein
MTMKRLLAATGFAVFGLLPSLGSACEYNQPDAASAQLAPAAPAAASKAPSPTIAQTYARKTAKPAPDKAKPAAPVAPDRKVAVATSS